MKVTMEHNISPEEADAVLLVLGLCEGAAEDAVLETIEGGELSRGYSALITLAGVRLAHEAACLLPETLAIVRRQAAAQADFTPAEMQNLTPAMDLIRALWVGDGGAVDYWMNPVRQAASMYSLSALCGLMLDFEAARVGVELAEVVRTYREESLRVLAG